MTQEEKVAMLKKAGVWDVIGFPSCIDKLFDLVAAHEREKHNSPSWETVDDAIAAERESIARMFDSSPKLMPYAQNAEGGCLTCGFSAEYAAAAIRARGE